MTRVVEQMIEPVRVNVSKSKRLGLCVIISVARGLNHASKIILDLRGCLRPGFHPHLSIDGSV